MGEWALLGEWQASPVSLVGVDLAVLRERLRLVGRAKSSLAAFEADLVGEITRREGEAKAEEILRRDQKRSLAGARKAVKVAAQLEWMPGVAEKLAEGAITPEAASLTAEAAAETPVDQNFLLDAAEQQADDLFRRTLKHHINERTNDEELQARRDRQRRRRRASISEQPDGMFNLFARLDPLTGARLRGALSAKADELFRAEDPQQRATPQQRLADALEQLACHPNTTGGRRTDAELVVLADYDAIHDKLVNAASSTAPASPKPKPSPSPATPTSCRASSTNTPATSSSAKPAAKSAAASANASPSATAAASAAAPQTKSAKSTTSNTGNTTDQPPTTTPASSAGAATTSASTTTANKSPATPTATTPSNHQPTPPHAPHHQARQTPEQAAHHTNGRRAPTDPLVA